MYSIDGKSVSTSFIAHLLFGRPTLLGATGGQLDVLHHVLHAGDR